MDLDNPTHLEIPEADSTCLKQPKLQCCFPSGEKWDTFMYFFLFVVVDSLGVCNLYRGNDARGLPVAFKAKICD